MIKTITLAIVPLQQSH